MTLRRYLCCHSDVTFAKNFETKYSGRVKLWINFQHSRVAFLQTTDQFTPTIWSNEQLHRRIAFDRDVKGEIHFHKPNCNYKYSQLEVMPNFYVVRFTLNANPWGQFHQTFLAKRQFASPQLLAKNSPFNFTNHCH